MKGERQRDVICSCLCRYWKLDPGKVYSSSPNAWDTAVHDASEEYKHRMVQLCVCVCVISPLRVALVGVAPVQCVGVGSLKDGLSNSFLCSSTTFAVITAILTWLWP